MKIQAVDLGDGYPLEVSHLHVRLLFVFKYEKNNELCMTAVNHQRRKRNVPITANQVALTQESLSNIFINET